MIIISGSGPSSGPSRGIKFGNWVEELHYTQHPEEVLFQFYVINCIQQFPISFVSTLTAMLQVLFQFYVINNSQYLLNLCTFHHSVAGGKEESEGRQHCCGSLQPHEVPPLHRDLEEGGDRGLVKVFEQQGKEKRVQIPSNTFNMEDRFFSNFTNKAMDMEVKFFFVTSFSVEDHFFL